MRKWIVAFMLFAIIVGESSCVVRVKERRHPVPPPGRVIVY